MKEGLRTRKRKKKKKKNPSMEFTDMLYLAKLIFG